MIFLRRVVYLWSLGRGSLCMSEKQNLLTLRGFESDYAVTSVRARILMGACGFSFFVILPMKITPALISVLMYSSLHLTLEYVTANYHYPGREIRALGEGPSMKNKRGLDPRFGTQPKHGNQTSWNWCRCSHFFFVLVG